MKVTRLFIYMFLLLSVLLVACSRPSNRQILNEVVKLYDRNQVDSAAFLLEEKIIPASLSDSDKADYWFLLAVTHHCQDRSMINDSLLHYTLQYDKEHGRPRLFKTYELLASYNNWAELHEKNGALYREAIAEAEARQDSVAMSRMYHWLTNYYYNRRDYQAVISLTRKLATFSEQGKATAWYILGLNYGRMGIEDSAAWYLSRAAELAYEIKSDQAFHYARNYADHISSTDPKEALAYLRHQKTIYPKFEFNSTYAEVWLCLGQKDSADYYLAKAESELDSYDPWYITGRVNLLALRMVWQAKNDLQYDLSTIGQYCDSVSFVTLRLFQSEKERAFAQHKLIQDNTKIEVNHQRVLLFLFAFLFVFVLIGSFTFFYIRNRRDKLQEVQEKLETLQQLLREASMREASPESPTPDSTFFRKVLLQQLGIIRLMATSPTEQNKDLLQQMSRIANEDVPVGTLLVWDDLYPLVDAVYNNFYTRLTELAAGRLSEKEIQLCCLLCADFSTKEISVVAQQSVRTIYQRKTNIRHALGMDEKDDIVGYINTKS